MTVSIKTKITAISVAFIVALALFSVLDSRTVFLREIDRLYTVDYLERIENFAWEYQNIDAMSAATEEAARLQNELLDRLEARYLADADYRGAPYIFNGDGQAILTGGDGVLDVSFVELPVTERVMEQQEGSFLFSEGGVEFWTVFSYYEPWDWYTGYVMENAERLDAVRAGTRDLVIAAVAAVIILTAAYVVYLNSVLNPLRRASGALKGIADGDVTQNLAVKSRDEIGEIASSVNSVVDGLRDILTSIQNASRDSAEYSRSIHEKTVAARTHLDDITSNAGSIRHRVSGLESSVQSSSESMERISAAMADLGRRIDDQFAAVTESSAAVEQMAASLNNVAAIVRAKLDSTNVLRENGRVGAEKVADTSEAIREIQSRVEEIAGFVDIIAGIADQTNLLSMNAAIEAAHAGESGKGFAVVSEEIRKLAEVASGQSAQIATTIEGIVEKTAAASRSGQAADAFFIELDDAIQEVVGAFHEIAGTTAELSSGSEEINKAISSLNAISVRVKERSAETDDESRKLAVGIDEVRDLARQVAEEIASIEHETRDSRAEVEGIVDLGRSLSASVDRLHAQVSRYRTSSSA